MEEETQYIILEGIKITDWIKAFAQVIGIPAAIWGIISLFRKDKSKERKLNSLEDLVRSQSEINETLKNQIEELKNQTKQLWKQSTLIMDSNHTSLRNLELEIQKYEDETELKYEVLEQYLLELLKDLIQPIKNQIKNIDKFINELAEEKWQNHALPIETTLEIENIKQIDHKELYKVFVIKKEGSTENKVDAFLKLEKAINHIKFMKSRFEKDLDYFQEKLEIGENIWNKNVKGIQSKFENYVAYDQQNNIPPDQDPFVKELDKIVWTWQNKDQNISANEKIDPFYMMNHFIIPIKDFCNQNIRDPRAMTFVPYINECQFALNNFVNLKKASIRQFVSHKKNLERTLDNLEEVLEYFR